MKKKNVIALMCSVCIGVTAAAAPAVVMAEETEAVTEAADGAETEAVTEADVDVDPEVSMDMESEADSEESSGAAADEEKESESEEDFEMMERPEYEASGYVELGEYKGLTVQLEPIEVTDEEVISQIRANAGSDILEEYTEGTVEEGDTANIDYEGKLDGEAFDGGTAKGYDLEIGSGTFIDGFEEGLVGVKVGETVDLPLTFPENYTEELAGKDVIFTVTVNSVKRMPELTSELVNEVTEGEYSDVDTYKESVKADLLAAKEDSRDGQIKSDLITQVANVCKIKDYPQEMLDYGMSNMRNTYKQMAGYYGMEYAEMLEAYLGLTEEEFEEQALLAVKQNLQAELYLKAIAENENMELSDEEYQTRCDAYTEQYGYSSKDELVAAYGEATLRISALEDKVLDFLQENAVIEEPETESETGSEAETGEQEAGSEAETE